MRRDDGGKDNAGSLPEMRQHRYAEFQNMEIVSEYSDEGKSGKSVEGRPEFQRMLDNAENGIDEVQLVLVFKLS